MVKPSTARGMAFSRSASAKRMLIVLPHSASIAAQSSTHVGWLDLFGRPRASKRRKQKLLDSMRSLG